MGTDQTCGECLFCFENEKLAGEAKKQNWECRWIELSTGFRLPFWIKQQAPRWVQPDVDAKCEVWRAKHEDCAASEMNKVMLPGPGVSVWEKM